MSAGRSGWKEAKMNKGGPKVIKIAGRIEGKGAAALYCMLMAPLFLEAMFSCRTAVSVAAITLLYFALCLGWLASLFCPDGLDWSRGPARRLLLGD